MANVCGKIDYLQLSLTIRHSKYFIFFHNIYIWLYHCSRLELLVRWTCLIVMSPSRHCKHPCWYSWRSCFGNHPSQTSRFFPTGASIAEATRHYLLTAKLFSAIEILVAAGFLCPFSASATWLPTVAKLTPEVSHRFKLSWLNTHDRMILRIHMVHRVFDVSYSIFKEQLELLVANPSGDNSRTLGQYIFAVYPSLSR